MRIPFVTFKPLEKKLDKELRGAFERVYTRSWYIEGEEDQVFEDAFAKYCGSNYCVGVGNGLDALFLALKALGIKEEDEVIVPSNTYIATALAVTYVGATPVFVEPDIRTFNIDPTRIEAAITNKTKAIMPVHLYGQACDMDPIMNIAKKYNLYVIEDCAHAHGSMIFDKYAGTFGDVGTFSFFLTKPLTSGEGGIIITNNAEIDRKLRMIRNYGKDSDGYHVIKGSSWRMNEFTGVVALSQIRSHNKIILEKQRIAKKYDKLLENNKYFKSLTSQEINGYYKYIIINKSNIPISYLITSMESKYNIKLPGLVYSHLCHEEPFIIGNNKVKGVMKYYKNATFLARNHLCLPIYMGLSEDSVEYIIDCLNRACEDYYSE